MTVAEAKKLRAGDAVIFDGVKVFRGEVVQTMPTYLVIRWDDGIEGDFSFGQPGLWSSIRKVQG